MKRLRLLEFLPFRLNRLAAETSAALAHAYRPFDIDIPEWRVIATLGDSSQPRSATVVVRSTRTHKSRISRAVSSLVRRGLVESVQAADDARAAALQLSPAGQRVYAALVPLMLAREDELLSILSPPERAEFLSLLTKLEQGMGLALAATSDTD